MISGLRSKNSRKLEEAYGEIENPFGEVEEVFGEVEEVFGGVRDGYCHLEDLSRLLHSEN